MDLLTIVLDNKSSVSTMLILPKFKFNSIPIKILT